MYWCVSVMDDWCLDVFQSGMTGILVCFSQG